jgi:polysaccharide chain length determinant protein (PEP-CTERM system associated)
MAVAWVVCVAGWSMVLAMPDIYQATARVYVDADSRLADVVGQIGVAPGVGSRVFVVRQAMLGIPQLERVARETDLDLRARTDDEKEALLLALRDKISVSTGRSREAQNLYTISFEDHDRQMSIAVVQKLLNTFVEDVLELKEAGVEDVTGYLQDQLDHYSGLLSESESRLAAFKKQHVGLLPGGSGGIFERLQTDMDQLKQLRVDLQTEIDRRDELRRQLTVENPQLEDAEGSAGIPGSTTDTRIKELEATRAGLLLTFTERHPDVVAINEQLEQLYAEGRKELEALRATAPGFEGAPNASNPVYQTAQIALNDANVVIAGLRSQMAQREQITRELNEQINTIPEIEAEFTQLTRDYAQYRSLYNELLMQKERERLGSVGKERDVVKFNIVQPPTATFQPVAPQRGILIIVVLLAGLGIGGGLAFLSHQLKPVFQDADTLHRISGLPVLGVVSMIWLDRSKAARRVDLTSFAAASTALLTLFVVTIVLQDAGVRLVHDFLAQSRG